MGQGIGYHIQAQLGTGVRYDPWNLQTEVKDDIICQIVVGYCWEFFDSGSLCWISLFMHFLLKTVWIYGWFFPHWPFDPLTCRWSRHRSPYPVCVVPRPCLYPGSVTLGHPPWARRPWMSFQWPASIWVPIWKHDQNHGLDSIASRASRIFWLRCTKTMLRLRHLEAAWTVSSQTSGVTRSCIVLQQLLVARAPLLDIYGYKYLEYSRDHVNSKHVCRCQIAIPYSTYFGTKCGEKLFGAPVWKSESFWDHVPFMGSHEINHELIAHCSFSKSPKGSMILPIPEHWILQVLRISFFLFLDKAAKVLRWLF